MRRPSLRRTVRNMLVIARREYLYRIRSRSFVIATIVLVISAVAVALAPVGFRLIGRAIGPGQVAVVVGASEPSVDVVAALDGLLNRSTTAQPSAGDRQPAFTVSAALDLGAARAELEDGKLTAVLALRRTSEGDLAFDLYTRERSFEQTPQLIEQAATSLVVQDRLSHAGIPPLDQARLFAPPSFEVHVSGQNGQNGPSSATSAEQFVNSYAIGFALSIFLFMAIMLYGQWVAMSVAEEKSSRVMEVILGAATPFQLLGGKVVGVGAVALTQYVAVFVPAALGLLFQDRIAGFLLGETATSALPSGLTLPLLLGYGLLFVLGFALYAVLYAGVASTVTRQEDVNQAVSPLTLLSTGGYMIAVWAGTGLIEAGTPIVAVLTFVPFTAPYMLVSRLASAGIGPVELMAALALLVVSVPVALWAAARLYTAGVLLYGQRPTLRMMLRVLRSA